MGTGGEVGVDTGAGVPKPAKYGKGKVYICRAASAAVSLAIPPENVGLGYPACQREQEPCQRG